MSYLIIFFRDLNAKYFQVYIFKSSQFYDLMKVFEENNVVQLRPVCNTARGLKKNVMKVKHRVRLFKKGN